MTGARMLAAASSPNFVTSHLCLRNSAQVQQPGEEIATVTLTVRSRNSAPRISIRTVVATGRASAMASSGSLTGNASKSSMKALAGWLLRHTRFLAPVTVSPSLWITATDKLSSAYKECMDRPMLSRDTLLLIRLFALPTPRNIAPRRNSRFVKELPPTTGLVGKVGPLLDQDNQERLKEIITASD